MEEAEDILFNNAINTSHYRLYNKFSDDSIEYYKIYGKTKIYKFIHKVPYPNMVWINKETILSHKIKLELKNNYYIYIYIYIYFSLLVSIII